MAARFGADFHVVGDHVRRLAAVNYADVAGARLPSLFNRSVPAILHQVGDGERRDGDGADAVLRLAAGVTGDAVNIDCHSVAAGRADGDLGGRAAVEVERQFRFAQGAEPGQPGAVQADFFLHRPQQRQRRMGDAAAQQRHRRRQQGTGTGAVVGAQTGFRVGRHNSLALPHRARTDTDRHGVYMGDEHAPRTGDRAGQLQHEVADLPASGVRRWTSSTVSASAGTPASESFARMKSMTASFLATAARNCHHFGHQRQRRRIGNRCFRSCL